MDKNRPKELQKIGEDILKAAKDYGLTVTVCQGPRVLPQLLVEPTTEFGSWLGVRSRTETKGLKVAINLSGKTLIWYYILAKGQIISNGVLKFSQKTNKRIHRISKNEIVRSFFGRIRNCICWTVSSIPESRYILRLNMKNFPFLA